MRGIRNRSRRESSCVLSQNVSLDETEKQFIESQTNGLLDIGTLCRRWVAIHGKINSSMTVLGFFLPNPNMLSST